MMRQFATAQFLRGICKLTVVVLLADQVLTIAFGFVAKQLDAGLSHSTVTLFSGATCALVSMWLQADARRAFGFARAKGFVTVPDDMAAMPSVAPECPKRWLVLLHIELNPVATRA